MSKFIYYIFVVVISYEFVTVAIAALLAFAWTQPVELLLLHVKLSPESMKLLSLLPGFITAWILKECKTILFPGDGKDKVIQEWEDYWKLKAHFNVTLFYAALFASIAATPWIFAIDITSIKIFPFYMSAIIGQFLVAHSVYTAQIDIKERLVKHMSA